MELPGRIATPNGSLTLPAFGDIERPRLLAVDDLFAVVSDKFPISPGHTLIIARRPCLLAAGAIKAREKVANVPKQDNK